MSSIIGHSLTGITVALGCKLPTFIRTTQHKICWLGWLVVVAIASDFDYIVPFFHPSANDGLRITHSIFHVSLLPSLTLIILKIFGVKQKEIIQAIFPLYLAGFSHLGLDLLVGVTAIPLGWPLSKTVFKLPFGILPSAGKPSLQNYYFYYNLGIEMGVLLPLSLAVAIAKSQTITWWKWVMVALLIPTSIYFMHWASGLSR